MPTLYHRTDHAAEILADGFRDSTGSYMLASLVLTGVFVSDEPLDINEGAIGDQQLVITAPDDADLSAWEIVEEMTTYREWCLPADVLNGWPVALVAEGDL